VSANGVSPKRVSAEADEPFTNTKYKTTQELSHQLRVNKLPTLSEAFGARKRAQAESKG